MAEIKITVADDGPYVIEGGVNVVDQDGDSYEERDVIALCRCGQSDSKPFCYGSHRTAEFSSSPRASES